MREDHLTPPKDARLTLEARKALSHLLIKDPAREYSSVEVSHKESPLIKRDREGGLSEGLPIRLKAHRGARAATVCVE